MSNHYNPIYRLILLTPYRLNRMQKKHFNKELERVFNFSPDPNKPLNVALVLRDGNSFPKSSAFVRLIAPLTHSSVAEKINLNFTSPKQSKLWHDEKAVYVVQRTAFDNLSAAQKFVKKIKRNNSKLIVDNDDAFHLISNSHPEYYTQVKRIDAIQYLFDQADRIWVSETNLVPKDHKKKTTVIKNSLDKRMWKTKRQSKVVSGAPIKMVYMGTATHDADFRMILPALDTLHEKYQGSFSLTAIGVSQDIPERPWIDQINPPRFGSLYPSFVDWFLRQGPFDIGLSPLVDNEFNRAKSDIKCLDYIAAGISPLVSDVEPYRNKDLRSFIIKIDNDVEAWFRELSKIVADPKSFREKKTKIMPRAQKYLWSKRSAEITAKLLYKELRDLDS